MIYTSYYANLKKLPKGLIPVSISRFPPKYFDGVSDKNLAPSEELLLGYKAGKYTKEDYVEIYKKQLSELDAFAIYAQHKNHVLLCYEKKEDFCHRHLLSEWLRKSGIRCEEKVGLNYLILISKDNPNYENIMNRILFIKTGENGCVIKILGEEDKNDIGIADYVIYFLKGGEDGEIKINKPYKKFNNIKNPPFLAGVSCEGGEEGVGIENLDANIIHVYGENYLKKGNVGQLKIRKNENSFGIMVKKSHKTDISSYYSDQDEEENILVEGFQELWAKARDENRKIIFPLDGLGGDLKNKSPNIFKKMNTIMDAFFGLKEA